LKNQGRVTRLRGGPTHPPRELQGVTKETRHKWEVSFFGGEKGANAGHGSSFPASSQVDPQDQLAVLGPSVLFLLQRLMGS